MPISEAGVGVEESGQQVLFDAVVARASKAQGLSSWSRMRPKVKKLLVHSVGSLKIRQTWARFSCWDNEMNDIKKGSHASV